MFKDLEHAFPEEWSQETSMGSLGAFVRSISAEFLLWMASIFVILAVTMAILLFVIPAPDMTNELLAKIVAILVNLAFLTFFFIFAYVQVKRIQPPLADSKKFTEKFRAPRSIVAFYCATAMITLIAYACAYI
jgi:fumarate reductase subunit D